MATRQALTAISRRSETDNTASQYHICEQGATAGEVDICNGAGDVPTGVFQNAPDTDQAARVATAGVTQVIAGAAVSVGNLVGTNASGRAILKSSDGDWIIGQALTAASANGEEISVQMNIMQLTV